MAETRVIDPQAEVIEATPGAIARAAGLVRDGGLVAFPTETVYGLGADATNDDAVAAIFAAKERPTFNPLIVHCADRDQAERYVAFNDQARLLADTFWPGPLTLVLPRKAEGGISLLVSAGLDTLAVRVPDSPIAQALIRTAERPLAAPSANKSGEISTTVAMHVAHSLPKAGVLVLDGGRCRLGLESTVVDVTGDTPVLLRPGGVPEEVLAALVGPLGRPGNGSAPRSPGMLKRHYAPSIPIRLNAEGGRKGEALLAFGPNAPRRALNLSRKGDLQEAAANLFAMLRLLDQPGIGCIAVMPIPDQGLGRAINDRLRRAATPPDGADRPPAWNGEQRDDWNDERGPAVPCTPLPDVEQD
ncbi:MAG: threonylcarbamoyl-AMP synthase [Rhodobacterales bacterium]|nr:threonylcarbamoyl-AMP synthase [Rhodobacterales bacterium]